MSQAGEGMAQGDQQGHPGRGGDSGPQVSPPLPGTLENCEQLNVPAKVRPTLPAQDPELLQPKKGTERSYTDSTELCRPTHCRSLVASMLSSAFMSVGLLTLGFAEGPHDVQGEMGLLLRFAGGAFLFYIPIIMTAGTLERNYYVWAIQPGEPLHVAYPDPKGQNSLSNCRRIRQSYLMPCMCHMLSLLVFALLIRIPFGLDEPEDHLGTVLTYSVGGVLSAAVHLTLYQLLGPPISCKSYVFMMAPWTGLIPAIGASLLASAYIALRELAGPCVVVAMPILVGCSVQESSTWSQIFATGYCCSCR